MTEAEKAGHAPGRLDDRALIRVSGPGWRGFLQGLITQDVETLQAGEVRYGALLTPQGRLLHDLFIWGEAPWGEAGAGGEDGAVLDVDADGREGLVARLLAYRLRAKVSVAAVQGAALWSPDAAAGGASGVWAPDPRLAALGRRGYDLGPCDAHAAAVAYEARRLQLGVGDPMRDGLADKAYAVEANLDLLAGVDFRKGCFVGQETTSRMKRRAAVRTRLVPLSFDGAPPPPGSEVLAGTLRAGEVRSGVAGRALALMRIDRALQGDLTVEGRPVRLDPPAWLQPAIAEIAGQPA